MIKYILTSVLVAISFHFGLAQNYLMTSTQSGLHGSVKLVTGTFEDGLFIQPGYTWKGRVSGGLDFGKGKDNINKLNSTIVRPHLDVLVIKQNEEQMPISANIMVGYQTKYLPTTSYNSRSFQVGTAVFHEIQVDNIIKVVPQLGVLANKPLEKNGISDNKNIDYVYNLNLSLLWQQIYFDSGFFVSQGNRGFSLLVGYIL